jgi:predicted DNA-binding antitoxin AbrB/MazE fold protein
MQAVVATYRNGVLTPAKPLQLSEGSTVRLWIEPSADLREQMTSEDREFFEKLAKDREAVFRALAQ